MFYQELNGGFPLCVENDLSEPNLLKPALMTKPVWCFEFAVNFN